MQKTDRLLRISEYSGILIFIGVLGALAMLAQPFYEMYLNSSSSKFIYLPAYEVSQWGGLAFSIVEALFIAMIAISLRGADLKTPPGWLLWTFAGVSLISVLCGFFEAETFEDEFTIEDFFSLLYMGLMVGVAVSFIANKSTRKIGLSMLLFFAAVIVTVYLFDQNIVTMRSKLIRKLIVWFVPGTAYYYFKQCAKFLETYRIALRQTEPQEC